MKNRTAVIFLVLVLTFAVVLSGCAARRPYNNDIGYDTARNNNNGFDTGMQQGYGRNTGMNPGNNAGFPTLPNNNYGGRTGYDMNTGYNNNIGNNRTGFTGMDTGLDNRMGTPLTANNERLSRACEAVRGVDDANVVVTGNTAYCGIETDNVRNADITRIRDEVTRRIKAVNPNIQTVYVSNDTNFIDRLRRIGDGIRNGRPADGFTTELDDMVRNLNMTR
ncbi:MAG: YhcN/YlaJ family sporulation lipoprotein [Bacillota bacterium]